MAYHRCAIARASQATVTVTDLTTKHCKPQLVTDDYHSQQDWHINSKIGISISLDINKSRGIKEVFQRCADTGPAQGSQTLALLVLSSDQDFPKWKSWLTA